MMKKLGLALAAVGVLAAGYSQIFMAPKSGRISETPEFAQVQRIEGDISRLVLVEQLADENLARVNNLRSERQELLEGGDYKICGEYGAARERRKDVFWEGVGTAIFGAALYAIGEVRAGRRNEWRTH